MNDINQVLDVRGLNCPLPILKTRKIINTMSGGEKLQVISTDIGSVKDISAFCKQTGNELISTSEQNSEYIFVIMKS